MRVTDVANRVLGSIATTADLLLAEQWVRFRYIQLVSRAHFRHLRKLGEILLPKVVSAGTLTTTEGSKEVTLDATALAALRSIGDEIALTRVRFGTDEEVYSVAGWQEDTLLLQVPFADTGGAFSYNLFRTLHELSPEVQWLGDFIVPRLRRRLQLISHAELDKIAPARSQEDGGPSVVAEVGLSRDLKRLVEFYPPSDEDEVIRFSYFAKGDVPLETDEIPPSVDPTVLIDGALVDAMRYEMAVALRANQIETAAVWRNDYRAQETRWDRRLQEAAARDRGSQDDSAVLVTMFSSLNEGSDISTAEDEWWAFGGL